MSRKIIAKDGTVQPCPKCGNSTRFTIHSERAAEDCCDVWAQCTDCGYHPEGHEFEDVFGGTGDENARIALDLWNGAHEAATQPDGGIQA